MIFAFDISSLRLPGTRHPRRFLQLEQPRRPIKLSLLRLALGFSKMYNKPLTGSIMAEKSRRFEMMVIRHTRNDCTTAAVQAGITYIYSQPRYSFESLGSPCTSILKPCCVASIVCTHSKTQRIQTVPTVMMSDIAFFSSLVFT